MRIRLAPGDDPVALVRGATGADTILIEIMPGRDPLSLAMARAAIGPLAVELAPATRLNAVVPAVEANPADVEVAIAFLLAAPSTTGQILDIG